MTEAFWTTIAQVSATFAGLVFVGFSIYLGNIREATTEVKRSLPESEEVFGSLIYIVVYSNLLFYWLPSLLSLTNLTERAYPAQVTAAKLVFLGSLLLFLLLFIFIYRLKSIRQQWQSIRNAAQISFKREHIASPSDTVAEQAKRLQKARWLRRLIWWRMLTGQWLTVGNSLLILGLYFFYLFQGMERWLQVWAVINLGLGVTLSLIDLSLFRPENVLFANLSRLVEQLESQARETRDLMETLSRQFEKLRSSLSDEIRANLDLKYQVLRSNIPEGEVSLPLVQEFKELGPIVSLGEIKGYSQGLSLLHGGVKDFAERLEKAQCVPKQPAQTLPDLNSPNSGR
jgi:hypothetical protein